MSSNSGISSKEARVLKFLNHVILAIGFPTNILTLATLPVSVISLLVTWFPLAALVELLRNRT